MGMLIKPWRISVDGDRGYTYFAQSRGKPWLKRDGPWVTITPHGYVRTAGASTGSAFLRLQPIMSALHAAGVERPKRDLPCSNGRGRRWMGTEKDRRLV